MAFINNVKFQEIREAAKNGNEKAKMVLQAMRKFSPQEDIDSLVNDYYSVQINTPANTENPIEANFQPENEALEPVSQENVPEELVAEEVNEPNPENVETFQTVDLSDVLDKDMDGLLDENKIDDLSFIDFLKNKSRDSLRQKKNADYFKAYDLDGRTNYLNNKIEAYKGSFNGRLRDIDRRYRDMGNALEKYAFHVNNALDDDVELDMGQAENAYNELVNNNDVMASFGRSWDEMDTEYVLEALKELVAKYGKKNIIAAVNTLKSDNENYNKFLNNQVDTEINRYSKSISDLLK